MYNVRQELHRRTKVHIDISRATMLRFSKSSQMFAEIYALVPAEQPAEMAPNCKPKIQINLKPSIQKSLYSKNLAWPQHAKIP